MFRKKIDFQENNFKEEFFNNRFKNLENSQIPLTLDFLNEFCEILNFLHPYKLKSSRLTRIGPNFDGGYVVSDKLLEAKNDDWVVSIGIGEEFQFEEQMLEKGYSVLGADGTIPDSPIENSNFTFVKSNVGLRKYGDENWISYENLITLIPNKDIRLLKIDIEGFEYEILFSVINEVRLPEQLIVEFHGLELLHDKKFRKYFLSLLMNLNRYYAPIHLHGNNSGRSIRFPHADFPTILEVTFLKKDLCESKIEIPRLPIKIDYPNTSDRTDFNLSPFFDLSKSFLGVLMNILRIKLDAID